MTDFPEQIIRPRIQREQEKRAAPKQTDRKQIMSGQLRSRSVGGRGQPEQGIEQRFSTTLKTRLAVRRPRCGLLGLRLSGILGHRNCRRSLFRRVLKIRLETELKIQRFHDGCSGAEARQYWASMRFILNTRVETAVSS